MKTREQKRAKTGKNRLNRSRNGLKQAESGSEFFRSLVAGCAACNAPLALHLCI